MEIFTLFVLLFLPNQQRLGDDDWGERESETRRCNNPISAALLKPNDSDPEIAKRVLYLRSQNLKWFDPVWIEGLVLREDFPRWVDHYLMGNRSVFARDEKFFRARIWNNADAQRELTGRYSTRHYGFGRRCSFGFLRPGLAASDFPQHLDFLDYHNFIAPFPAER